MRERAGDDICADAWLVVVDLVRRFLRQRLCEGSSRVCTKPLALTLVICLPVKTSKDLENVAVAVVTSELVASPVEAQDKLARGGTLAVFWTGHDLRHNLLIRWLGEVSPCCHLVGIMVVVLRTIWMLGHGAWDQVCRIHFSLGVRV